MLATHFASIIDSIVANTWKHYSLSSGRRGKGPFVFDQTEMEKKKVLQLNPSSFLLQPSFLRCRLLECGDSIVASFRVFAFDAYNPAISTLFGASFVVDPGSGIEALFPPRRVGRPKMQKLTAKRDASDSDSSSLVDILGQARDAATKEVFVPCEVPLRVYRGLVVS